MLLLDYEKLHSSNSNSFVVLFILLFFGKHFQILILLAGDT